VFLTVGSVVSILFLLPRAFPCSLAFFEGAIFLIIYSGIRRYRFATVQAGNCWDHCENLSKLKDADFQQLTINLFYLITKPDFQSKKAQFLFCKFLVEEGIKKTDVPAYCIKCNGKKSNSDKDGTIFCRKVVSV
jgi:hypothetical protein